MSVLLSNLSCWQLPIGQVRSAGREGHWTGSRVCFRGQDGRGPERRRSPNIRLCLRRRPGAKFGSLRPPTTVVSSYTSTIR